MTRLVIIRFCLDPLLAALRGLGWAETDTTWTAGISGASADQQVAAEVVLVTPLSKEKMESEEEEEEEKTPFEE